LLQLSSKRDTKTIEIDGYGFHIRKPGAGESLTLQEGSRRIEAMGKLKELTASQEAEGEALTVKLLGICLALYSGMDDKATAYLQTVEVEMLMEGINAVFNPEENETTGSTTEAKAEPAPANA